MSYLVAAIVAVVLTAVSQVFFKLGSKASIQYKSKWAVYINRYSICAYALLFAVTILNLYAFGKIELRYATVILPFTFVLVCLFSVFFLHERMTKLQLVGTGIIVFGVLVYNL